MLYKLENFIDRYGNEPYARWFDKLKNMTLRDAITERMFLIEEHGDFGKHKSLRGGLWELHFDIGPGYRVYYMLEGRMVILLLCGGNKTSQDDDIALARKYIKYYRLHHKKKR